MLAAFFSRCGQVFQSRCFILKKKQQFFPFFSFKLPAVALLLGKQFDGFLDIARSIFQLPDYVTMFLQLPRHVEDCKKPIGKSFPHGYLP